MCQHGFDHIGIARWFYDIKEGMKCPVGIPKRERSVICKSYSLVDVLIESFVFTVLIGVDGWTEEGMVHGGVEVYFIVFADGFNFNAFKLLVPFLLPFAHHAVEIPMRNLGLHILQRVLLADGRQSEFNQDLFVLLGIEIEMQF